MGIKKQCSTVVLYNPSSGGGRSLKLKGKVESSLAENGVDYDLYITESEAHLRQLAAKCAGKYETIVGVGGDTTFNIIAEKILEYKNEGNGSREKRPAPAMGMIGTGSANDIVRSLGIESIDAACKAIKIGDRKQMDVGRLTLLNKKEPEASSFIFLGTLSLGLGTTVNRYVESYQREHKLLSRINPLNQLFAGIYGIHHSFSKKKIPLQVELAYHSGNDNGKGNGGGHGDANDAGAGAKKLKQDSLLKKENIRFSLLVFLNTPYYANGLKMVQCEGTPAPVLFDGKLDCCIIDTGAFWETFRAGLKVKKGEHNEKDGIRMLRAGLFNVTCVEELDIQVDGEIIEEVKEFEVSLVPEGLTVLL
ncbi:MAG: hypothetical protein GY757_16260 [bacterium]|nr:hypothetical protein [bacterium]